MHTDVHCAPLPRMFLQVKWVGAYGWYDIDSGHDRGDRIEDIVVMVVAIVVMVVAIVVMMMEAIVVMMMEAIVLMMVETD